VKRKRALESEVREILSSMIRASNEKMSEGDNEIEENEKNREQDMKKM